VPLFNKTKNILSKPAVKVPNLHISLLWISESCSTQKKEWKQNIVTSTHRSGISESYERKKYCSTFTFMNIKQFTFFHSLYYMLRQIMVVIITPLGHAQIYSQRVRSVLIMTEINTLYENKHNKNNSKNNKQHATHERDKRL